MIVYKLMRLRSIEFAVIANPNYRSLRTSSLSWCAHWFGMTMLFGAPTSLQIPIKAIGLKPQTDHLNLQGRRSASRSKRENHPKGLGVAVNRLLCKGTGNPSPTKRIDTEFSAKFQFAWLLR